MAVGHDRIDDVEQMADDDLDPRLLADLAHRGLARRLAQLLAAARQAPLALARRPAAPDQQDLAVLPDDDADAGDRIVGIFAGSLGHGVRQ